MSKGEKLVFGKNRGGTVCHSEGGDDSGDEDSETLVRNESGTVQLLRTMCMDVRRGASLSRSEPVQDSSGSHTAPLVPFRDSRAHVTVHTCGPRMERFLMKLVVMLLSRQPVAALRKPKHQHFVFFTLCCSLHDAICVVS